MSAALESAAHQSYDVCRAGTDLILCTVCGRRGE